MPRHEPGFLAARMGITLDAGQEYLNALLAAGRVRHNGQRYEPASIRAIDTRGDDENARVERRYFARLAADRVTDGGPVAAGYNVLAGSREDYGRIAALQRSYYTKLRAIVAKSEPSQVVALATTQLLTLCAELPCGSGGRRGC